MFPAPNPVAIMLVVLIALGVLSHNNTITLAAAILLLIQQTALERYLPWIEKNGVYIGIIILTIGVLSPMVSGKIKLEWTQFISWQMLLAIIVGICVAWLGGRGVHLMQNQPNIIPGLLVGTVLGVAFLRGVPVGPLIAAGLLSLVLSGKT